MDVSPWNLGWADNFAAVGEQWSPTGIARKKNDNVRQRVSRYYSSQDEKTTSESLGFPGLLSL